MSISLANKNKNANKLTREKKNVQRELPPPAEQKKEVNRKNQFFGFRLNAASEEEKTTSRIDACRLPKRIARVYIFKKYEHIQ